MPDHGWVNLVDGKIADSAQSCYVGHGHTNGDVYLAGLQGEHTRGVIRNNAEANLFEYRLFAPVGVVTHQREFLTGDVAQVLKGPRAVRDNNSPSVRKANVRHSHQRMSHLLNKGRERDPVVNEQCMGVLHFD